MHSICDIKNAKWNVVPFWRMIKSMDTGIQTCAWTAGVPYSHSSSSFSFNATYYAEIWFRKKIVQNIPFIPVSETFSLSTVCCCHSLWKPVCKRIMGDDIIINRENMGDRTCMMQDSNRIWKTANIYQHFHCECVTLQSLICAGKKNLYLEY